MCILVDFASSVKPWSYFSLLSAVLATVDCLILSPFLLSFIDERKDEYDPLGPEGSLHSVGNGTGELHSHPLNCNMMFTITPHSSIKSSAARH